MDSSSWLLIAILLAIILLAILAIFIKRKTPIDYYSLFIMGIAWFVLGLPMKNYALSIIGLVFMIIGFKNKDKWKKNKSLNKLTKKQKWIRIILSVVLGILVAAFIVLFISKNI